MEFLLLYLLFHIVGRQIYNLFIDLYNWRARQDSNLQPSAPTPLLCPV